TCVWSLVLLSASPLSLPPVLPLLLCLSFTRVSRPPPTLPLFPYTPLSRSAGAARAGNRPATARAAGGGKSAAAPPCGCPWPSCRSEEHTSELQSRFDLVCRLLLEKKKGSVAVSSLSIELEGFII